jgi:transposase
MRSYSADLRVLFVRYLDGGMSARGAGVIVGVSASTSVRWAQRWREEGLAAPKAMGGYKPYLLDGERDWLVAQVERDKSLTLHEMLELLRVERGVVVSCDTLWRYLKRCGKTFKKSRSTRSNKAAPMSSAGSIAGAGCNAG